MEYLYHYHLLYPEGKSSPGQIEVAEDTLVCYDVRPEVPSGLAQAIQGAGAKAWTFSVRGMEGRFITHYDWTLIRKTEQNEVRIAEIAKCHAERQALQRKIHLLWKTVDTAAKDLLEGTHDRPQDPD